MLHDRRLAAVLLALALLAACRPAEEKLPPLTNLSHLQWLYEPRDFGGRPAAVIHIYSEAPDYKWVNDADEGMACVDDAARAAVVFLRHAEIFADTASIVRARSLLNFIRGMQAESGLFYNFIFPDGRINREGPTSRATLGWWTARAVWALGRGVQFFSQRDRPFAQQLERHLRRVFWHLDTLLANYPRVNWHEIFVMPRWLIAGSAADATSELMLGLEAFARTTEDDFARRALQLFGQGLLRMQLGDSLHFPFGALISWRNMWHGWGNSQSWALLRAGKLLDQPDFRLAARKEIDYFYPFVLRRGFLHQMELHRPLMEATTVFRRYEQIAYDIRPMFMAALSAYRMTQEPAHAQLALRLAGWFFGDNPAGARMYDPSTGRCFDGILDAKRINRNSGAESTIEALMVMLELDAEPALKRELIHRYRVQ